MPILLKMQDMIQKVIIKNYWNIIKLFEKEITLNEQ